MAVSWVTRSRAAHRVAQLLTLRDVLHIVFAPIARRLCVTQLRKHPTQCYPVMHTETENFGMPYYTFDLVVGDEFRNQGTIILEDLPLASDRADQLACELSQVKPELKACGCAVRVTDVDRCELYRTPLDPVPQWRRTN